MQNSVAPDLAVCLAASTRLGMLSHALRTGEAKGSDCAAEMAILRGSHPGL